MRIIQDKQLQTQSAIEVVILIKSVCAENHLLL